MKHKLWILPGLMALLALILSGCSGSDVPPQVAQTLFEPTAEPTPLPTDTPTPEPEVTYTPSPSPTPDVTPTPVPPELLYDITVFPPTCVSNGYSVYVSHETGGINIRDEVPRLKHDYSDWSVNLQSGEISRTCSMCHGVDSRKADGLARIILFGDLEELAREGAAAMEAYFVVPKEKLGFTGTAQLKWPGYSERSREKRDLTVTFYDDEAMTVPHPFALLEGVEMPSIPLTANTIDVTQVRNTVCARVWREISGTREASLSLPVTLYINGDFKGLYAVELPPGADLYGMEKGKRQAAITPVDRSRDTPPLLGSAENAWQVLFSGDDDGEWALQSMNDLIDFIKNSPDDEFHEQLRAYLDPESAIDALLFTYAMGLYQSASCDIAFLKDDEYDPWRLAPFDMCDAFNLDYDGSIMPSDAFLPEQDEDGVWSSGTKSPLWDRLLNVFSEEIALRWQELRQSALDDTRVARWMRYELRAMPDNTLRADRALFYRPVYLNDPAEQMQQFIRERIAILDGVLK